MVFKKNQHMSVTTLGIFPKSLTARQHLVKNKVQPVYSLSFEFGKNFYKKLFLFEKLI